MQEKQLHHINISAPNLLNICVDDDTGHEWSGRLYHCYSKTPILFTSVVDFLTKAEDLFDVISFPQASTKTRHFFEKEEVHGQKLAKVVEQREILEYEGKIGTFILQVRYRQKSTWQGEIFWKERELTYRFTNILEMLRWIDNVTSK